MTIQVRTYCHDSVQVAVSKKMEKVLLLVTAVAVSLAAEFLYAYVEERCRDVWVRSEVEEHREIVRLMGHVSFKPIREDG